MVSSSNSQTSYCYFNVNPYTTDIFLSYSNTIMIRTQDSEKLKILIQEADTIAIFGHENVDGDAV